MPSILDYLNPFSVLDADKQERYERKKFERERGSRRKRSWKEEEGCDCVRCGGKGYEYTLAGVPVGCAHCGGDGIEPTH